MKKYIKTYIRAEKQGGTNFCLKSLGLMLPCKVSCLDSIFLYTSFCVGVAVL